LPQPTVMPWRWRAPLAALLVAGALGGCGVPSATGPANSFGVDFSLPAGAPHRGAIVFLVDGVNARVFQEMLQAGELPAIRKYFAERGWYVPRAVANTPSVTLANLTSIATGFFPGHHGVTGINWFDRNQLIWRNYETIAQKNTLDGDYTTPTIFERLPGRTTFSIFYQPHRGATKFVENWTSAGPPFFFGWYEFVDRLTLHRFHVVTDVARKREAFPAVTYVYLLAPDFRAYEYGIDSPEYRDALRHTDRQIGRLLGDLASDGLLDDLLLVLTSDHGMEKVGRHFVLERFLRDQVGLDVARARLWEETAFEKRLNTYQRHAAVLYGSGQRYAALCLRRPVRGGDENGSAFEPWTVRPTAGDLANYPTRDGPVDLLSVLIAQEAVDAVAYATADNAVRVRTAHGEVEFTQSGGPGGPIRYHVAVGADPLSYFATVPAEMLAGSPSSPDDWLAATVETAYPDLPAQILAYFRARRAGDIAVFAAPGWDFRGSDRAGHGGLRPEEMHVPLLLAGPGLPSEAPKTARTADVAATILAFLGRPAPSDTDGRPLARFAPQTQPAE